MYYFDKLTQLHLDLHNVMISSKLIELNKFSLSTFN